MTSVAVEATERRAADQQTSWWVRALPALTALSFVLFAGISLARYARGMGGWDLAIFDQAVRHYAHLQAPVAPARGPHMNVLGDHFSPIWALVSPLYWLSDDPRVLLLVQAALIAASVPVVGRMVSRHFAPGLALALTTAYAVGWPLQQLLSFDVHEVAFAVPLLALAIDALDREDDRLLVIALVPLLAVREDMGMVLIAFGAVRLLLRGRDTRWIGFVLLALGTAGYAFATTVAIPHFAPGGSWIYWTYQALGPDLPSSLANIAGHPLHAIGLLVTPATKAVTLGSLLLPLLLLPLRSPYVVPALPLLAERFLSSRESLWTVHFHYSAVLWPILFLAAVDGARRFGPGAGQRLATGLATLGLVLPAVGLVVGGPYAVTLAAGPWAWHSDRATTARPILEAIPDGTCVEADEQLTPYLSARTVVSVPSQLGRTPDFIALDLGRGKNLASPAASTSLHDAVAEGFTVVGRSGTLVLLRSPSTVGPTAACTP